VDNFNTLYGNLVSFDNSWYVKGHLVYFEITWFAYVGSFGIFCGILVCFTKRKIWQPWLGSV
jgi:hypothetical protein